MTSFFGHCGSSNNSPSPDALDSAGMARYALSLPQGRECEGSTPSREQSYYTATFVNRCIIALTRSIYVRWCLCVPFGSRTGTFMSS